MQRKIFIGIDLPLQVKKRLVQATQKWHNLPVRWSQLDNLHITLLFIGHINDSMMPEVCRKISDACKKSEIFDVNFDTIVLGPEDPKKSKMFWFTGGLSKQLKKLEGDIERELDILRNEHKVFRPHVTLGRIRQVMWKQLPKIPKIKEKLNISIPIESVQIFESAMVDRKRKFIILESCPLSY